MKKIMFSVLLLAGITAQAQEIYTGVETEISFFSEAPLENIEAVNKEIKTFFKPSAKTLAIIIPIIKFKFEKPLMEEHFNENYLESEKFPTASFKGNINEDMDYSKDGNYDATATGKLMLHGVEQERTIPGKVTVKGNQITFESKFQVKLVDHNIEVPSLVMQNIAEIVDVTCKFVYEPKK